MRPEPVSGRDIYTDRMKCKMCQEVVWGNLRAIPYQLVIDEACLEEDPPREAQSDGCGEAVSHFRK
ncbi:hypothetical protein HJC23_007056 [Cyclotella cryptica]|uniref:Uncharacterized protein n=1 Tax=Cyclotella cryptica TaxID=29204 RepID=A0ABD3P8T0_9STRA